MIKCIKLIYVYGYRRKGFDVQSFGTGNKVKLPGKSAGRPNVYDFGCPYDTIYKDLVNKDEALYPFL